MSTVDDVAIRMTRDLWERQLARRVVSGIINEIRAKHGSVQDAADAVARDVSAESMKFAERLAAQIKSVLVEAKAHLDAQEATP